MATAMTMAATGALAAPNEAPNSLQLRCQTLDGDTGAPKTVFAPGDDIAVQIYLNVPAGRVTQKVELKAYLFAKIKGFNLGGEVADSIIEIPPQNVRETIPGYDPLIDAKLNGGFEIRNAATWIGVPFGGSDSIHIKNPFPEGDATVRIEAKVGGADAKTVHCGPTIRIRNPQ